MSPSRSTSKKRGSAPKTAPDSHPKSKAAAKSKRVATPDAEDGAEAPVASARGRKLAASATTPAPTTPAAPAKPTKGRGKPPVDLGEALVHAFETNERIHQFLLEHLEPSIWAHEAPVGKGRVIRGVFAHIHNVRRLWITRRGEDLAAPEKVDRESVTQEEMRAALAASSRAVVGMLREALAAGGHVADFKPDVAGFVAYAIAHEAHHRGQICMLARILGKPLPQNQGYELWNWRKRADEALDARGPNAAPGAPDEA